MVANMTPSSVPEVRDSASIDAVASSAGWVRHAVVENYLRRQGVDFDYVVQGIGLIDKEASFRNQARYGIVVKTEVVEEYATAMRGGDAFPALVAFMQVNGTYRLAGGNHRYAAALSSGRRSVAMYVVHTKDAEVQRRITTSLNALEGVRPSREELVQAAMAHMDQFQISQVEAADTYRIPVTALSAALRHRGITHRLQNLGIQPDRMVKSHMDRLATIKSDVTLRSAAEFQLDHRLSAEDLKRFVGDVTKESTEEKQSNVIRAWYDRDDMKVRVARMKERPGARVSATTRARAELLRVVNSCDRLMAKHKHRGTLGMTIPEDWERVKGVIQSIQDHTKRLDEAGFGGEITA